MGAISRAIRPAAIALAARSCDRRANASWSSRVTVKSCATFSAVCGIASVPYRSCIFGLMNRQPMVVSAISARRENAASGLGSTNGARLMLSTPPAMIRSASPARMARAAIPTASRPDPQSRLMVLPGASMGRSASSAAIRATLRLSSPAWLAQPSSTSSSADQSTDGSRSASARMTWAAMSSGRTVARAPA